MIFENFFVLEKGIFLCYFNYVEKEKEKFQLLLDHS